MNYRKLTPSMSLLLAFDAAARHESYTRAAEELSLTQSAVSRQVQALEALLGVTLFQRDGRRVVLTDLGRTYLSELTPGLNQIRRATLQALSFHSGAGTLRLATLPTFGSKWLLPRLHRFYDTHPGFMVHIHSRIEKVNFAVDQIDAAIAVGDDHWPDLTAHRLHTEALVLIASPAAMTRNFTLTQQALNQYTLLSVASFPQAWQEWCAHFGLRYSETRMGASFELTSHLIQAVIAGIGIGLVPRILVEDELRQGQLLTPCEPVVSRRSYYLVYPERSQALPSLVSFREWLLKERTTERSTERPTE